MSVGPSSSIESQQIEQTRRNINRLVEEIAALTHQEIGTAEFFGEFSQRVQNALAATATAVWLLTPEGHLQLQFQINLRQADLERTEDSKRRHDDLLRHALLKPQPAIVLPHSGPGEETVANGEAAANPTDYAILLSPILVERQVAGLIEVFIDPRRNLAAQRGFLQFLGIVGELAAAFLRNQRMRQMSGQQQLWSRLEAFSRQIHSSLDPTEVAYHVANEGNRLIGSDRLVVAVRTGRRAHVEAISGADVVERRSNLVVLMRELIDKVLKWNERLVYAGERDEGLPPDVLAALDAYLAESNSNLLIVQPLRDDREKDAAKLCRSALLLECFETNLAPEQVSSRLDVVARHAAPALYNAAEYRRIPLRFLWKPLAVLQDGLGGKARAIAAAVVGGLLLVIGTMVFVPYPLKMDAKGQLLPVERRYLYPPVEGHVERFAVEPGDAVAQGQNLVLLHDVHLELKMVNLLKEIDAAQKEIDALGARLADPQLEERERSSINGERRKQESIRDFKRQEFQRLKDRTNSVEGQPGHFWLVSPLNGTILSSQFHETLTNRFVKPSDPLLRIGDKDGEWEIELRVPQKHIGQVLQAFDRPGAPAELDVDLLLLTQPTQTFKGKLARSKIAGEATPNRDDAGESEPVVAALVRIDGQDIPEPYRVPSDLLLTGTEVHAKVRCGEYPLGYSLFYGVWEFLYEKIVFFF